MIKHNYYNGVNNEYKIINDLICQYDMDNTYENFMTMVEHLKPEFLRGAVTKDQSLSSAYRTAIHCDIVDIGLVYKGYKPMCYVEDEEIPDFYDKLGLYRITFDKQYRKTRREHIIYKDVNLKERATFLTKHIQELGKEDNDHHYIMGDYLGYPKEDVDYFVGK